MMDVHLLNGDSLAEKFSLKGEIIVFRECLIDGPSNAVTYEQFWEARAAYCLAVLSEGENQNYFTRVKYELEKLLQLNQRIDINLWFENDLFCQTNMWFLLAFIRSHHLTNTIYRVNPPLLEKTPWAGYGQIKNHQLLDCFSTRVLFSEEDIHLGVDLWKSYKSHDLKQLKDLSVRQSECFPFLEAICSAHIDRFSDENGGRPQRRLKEILGAGLTNFPEIFAEFSKTEGIYGFGDIQVKKMLSRI